MLFDAIEVSSYACMVATNLCLIANPFVLEQTRARSWKSQNTMQCNSSSICGTLKAKCYV